MVAKVRLETEKKRAKLTSLEGIFRWSPVRLTEQCMSFTTLSPFPESSVAISFDIPKLGSALNCRAKVDPTLYRQRLGHTRKLTKASAKFLKCGISELLRRHCSSSLKDPSDIPMLLQKLAWEFGRLEQTANELGKLERQFGANIVYMENKTYLEVEVCKLNDGGGTFVATIEISPTYPFKPLGLQVDVLNGQVDVKGLQKKLRKSTKPGFDYLTRIIACMST